MKIHPLAVKEVLLKTKTVNLMVAVQVTRVKGIHPLGNMIICTWKFIHPITLLVALIELISVFKGLLINLRVVSNLVEIGILLL